MSVTEPGPSRREVAVAGHSGDLETARRGLHSPIPGVRATALTALVRLGAARQHDIDVSAADPAADVRRRAAYLLPGLGVIDDTAIATLVTLLDDPDATVVEVACFAAGELTEKTLVGDLTPVVERLVTFAGGHDDSLCREAAVAALGSLGDPRGRDAVLAACEDRATVRRRAVLALTAFDGAEIDSMLERLTGDRDIQVRHSAEDLLAIVRGQTSGSAG